MWWLPNGNLNFGGYFIYLTLEFTFHATRLHRINDGFLENYKVLPQHQNTESMLLLLKWLAYVFTHSSAPLYCLLFYVFSIFHIIPVPIPPREWPRLFRVATNPLSWRLEA